MPHEMSPVNDPGQALYVSARRVLLDALEALHQHLQAVILVGAQAIYLHTGHTDLAVAEFTSDADLALDPSVLGAEPVLEQAMLTKGFVRDLSLPGVWHSQHEHIVVDIMVPEAVGGETGRRGVRLAGHGKHAARKVKGLEAVLTDRQEMTITSLDSLDRRSFQALVAGPSALLIAKLHKLWERQANPRRLDDKDALDVFRLLQAVETEVFIRSLTALKRDPVAGSVTRQGLRYLTDLFSTRSALGTTMAARAVMLLDDAEVVAASCVELTHLLLQEVVD